ncbi:MAG: CAP domain-containing protein [Bacteroidota bacterium]|nr:CAP domain-containing protein [Bacteroidota bacterium]MDP4204585.1 CAP domain-containing protein [Bacteroidota bacterium]
MMKWKLGLVGCVILSECAFTSCTDEAITAPVATSQQTANNTYVSPSVEQKILDEINLLRKSPSGYADFIAEYQKSYDDKGVIHYNNEPLIQSAEGKAAVTECINELKSTQPLGELTSAVGLAKGAKDLVADQSVSGGVGHTGSNGDTPSTRVSRYGKWLVTLGENIHYGFSDPRRIIMSLLIDDGVKDRGHRKNLLNSSFKKIGVAFGTHPVYKYMTVTDFAGGYTDNP